MVLTLCSCWFIRDATVIVAQHDVPWVKSVNEGEKPAGHDGLKGEGACERETASEWSALG